MSRPPKWIVQQVAHGAECALGDQMYRFAAGTTRSNTLSVKFGRAVTGLGAFGLAGMLDTAVEEAATDYAKVYNM